MEFICWQRRVLRTCLARLKCSFRYDRPRHTIRRPREKIRNESWRPEMDVVLFRGTDTNVSSWERGFWSTYTEVWSSSRIGCWTSSFRLFTRRTYRKLWRPSRSDTTCMQTAASFSTRQPSRTWMPVASGSRAVSNQFANGAQAADFNWILTRQN